MKKPYFNLLAIETTCDETSAAVVEIKNNDEIRILSNVVYSQVLLHQKTKGVVPEVAAREHAIKIIPVIQRALADAGINDIKNDIAAIAVASGPGLMGSLMIGVESAKTLAYLFDKPLYATNHIHGHIAAALAAEFPNSAPKAHPPLADNFQIPNLPILALTVSGGHTNLVLIKKWGDFQVVGETLDDAAGEAFDKIGTMLGLPYPAGVEIEKLAEKFAQNKLTLKNNITFPRPLKNVDNFDFSFSGLKTSVYYFIRKKEKNQLKKMAPQIAFEAQNAIVDVLVSKTIKAAQKLRPKTVILSGGVANNSFLRKELKLKIKGKAGNYKLKIDFLLSPKNLCTDNAAMIGLATAFNILSGKKPDSWQKIKANANLKI